MSEEIEKPIKEKVTIEELAAVFKLNGVTVKEGTAKEIARLRDTVQNILKSARNSPEEIIATLEMTIKLTKEQKKDIRGQFQPVQGMQFDKVKKYQTVHSILSSAAKICQELEG